MGGAHPTIKNGLIMSNNEKSTSIEKEYEKQLELMKWIDVHCRVKFSADRKSQLSHTCFDLAIEHHAAICILSVTQLYGSMFSLLRVLFESYFVIKAIKLATITIKIVPV